jgi:hypothetical protein
LSKGNPRPVTRNSSYYSINVDHSYLQYPISPLFSPNLVKYVSNTTLILTANITLSTIFVVFSNNLLKNLSVCEHFPSPTPFFHPKTHLPIDFLSLPAHNITMTELHPNTLVQKDLPDKSGKAALNLISLRPYSRPQPKPPKGGAHKPILTNNLQQPQTQVPK